MKIVYIVEDDPAVSESLSFFLEGADYAPSLFADPRKFIFLLGGLQPGCVLLDLRLPGVDGFGVLAQLASRRVQFPVVMMTGHGDVATAVRAMKLGAVDFLEKPFEEDVLLEILDRVFDTLDGSLREVSRKREAALRLSTLSNREREVLSGLLAGQPNKILAYGLGISVRTVEMHRAGMMDRLGVRTLAEALRLAFEGNLASLTSARPDEHVASI